MGRPAACGTGRRAAGHRTAPGVRARAVTAATPSTRSARGGWGRPEPGPMRQPDDWLRLAMGYQPPNTEVYSPKVKVLIAGIGWLPSSYQDLVELPTDLARLLAALTERIRTSHPRGFSTASKRPRARRRCCWHHQLPAGALPPPTGAAGCAIPGADPARRGDAERWGHRSGRPPWRQRRHRRRPTHP